MHHGKPRVGEATVDVVHALDAFVHVLLRRVAAVFVFANGIAHHANEFRSKFLHPRNGAADFRFSDGKIISDFFRPVANERAEAADLHVRGGELLTSFIKRGLGNLMQVAFHAVDLHAARLNAVPAEFLVGFDLHVE